MFVTAFIHFMVSTFMSGVRATTGQELKWLASAPVELQRQMRVQIELQKEQELVQMLVRTFDAICGWQKEEEALRSSARGSNQTRVRYSRA
ncbi:MAG: hypothetical protein JXB05_15405 [Myxococcaceae bacterium]|nr:hypothetical protein [Myxococcaceae bacterium]